MTSKRPRNRRAGEVNPIDPARYPALSAFFLGYLHQDVAIVHGDARGAMDAFIADADPDDLVRLAEEWRAFRSAVERGDGRRGTRTISRFAAGWAPASWGEVVAVFDRLSGALADLGLA